MENLDTFLKNKNNKQGIRLIKDSWIINIEITNFCKMRCSNCSRATKHITKPFFASLEFIEKALNSLKNWPKGIGIIGGEPQDHPQWNEICQLLKSFDHKGGYALFTSRQLPIEYNEIFDDKIYITDHKKRNLHHTMLISLSEIVPKHLQRELIEKCWLQKQWSPSITPKGAFWCEIAGVLDFIYNGTNSFALVEDWWKQENYENQIEEYCKKCGICIPFELTTDKDEYEYVTPDAYNCLAKLKSPYLHKCKIFNKTLSSQEIRKREKNKINPCYIHDRQNFTSDKYF